MFLKRYYYHFHKEKIKITNNDFIQINAPPLNDKFKTIELLVCVEKLIFEFDL